MSGRILVRAFSDQRGVMQDLDFGGLDPQSFDIVSVGYSGGKDSTALVCALKKAGIAFHAVYADTGWERTDENGENVVLRYVRETAALLDFPLRVVGYPGGMEARIREKGAMPKLGKTKWCTQQLKVKPMLEFMVAEWGDHLGRLDHVIRLTGVRWDESRTRATKPRTEEDQWGMTMVHPILHWTVEDVLAWHHELGVPVNPLYQEPYNMNRVGCWPCVMERKQGIRRIAETDPERIAKIRELEAHVDEVQRERGWERGATFFSMKRKQEDGKWRFQFAPIDDVVTWSKTKRRGDEILEEPPPSGCSLWGMCEMPDPDLSKRLPVLEESRDEGLSEEEEDCSLQGDSEPTVQAYEMDAFRFLRSLPDKSIDCIITDLPYPTKERHRRVGTTTRLSISKSAANLWFETLSIDQLCEFLELAYAKLKRNSYLFAYVDDDTERLLSWKLGVLEDLEKLIPSATSRAPRDRIGFKWWTPLTWLKLTQGSRVITEEDLGDGGNKKLVGMTAMKLAGGMGYHGAGCTERILILEKGTRKLSKRILNTFPVPRPQGRVPGANIKAAAAKPAAVAEELLRVATEPGDRVVDPFVGCGLHAKAAIHVGCHAIVNDHDLVLFRDWAGPLGLDPEYVDPDAAELQPPPPTPKQAKKKAKKKKTGANLDRLVSELPELSHALPRDRQADAEDRSRPQDRRHGALATAEPSEPVLPQGDFGAGNRAPAREKPNENREEGSPELASALPGSSRVEQGPLGPLVPDRDDPIPEPPEIKVEAPLPPVVEHVVFASYGNDSIALLQWAANTGLKNVVVAHSDTGWAADNWAERIDRCEEWVRRLGFFPHRIPSIGMINLVRKKKGWPLPRRFQFCTEHLKIKPAMTFLDLVDPGKEAVCMVGVRREESAERQQWPEHVEESDRHGGRPLWSPLVTFSTAQRDALVTEAGFEVLPHRSKECFPCINSNRADLRLLTPERVELIEQLERNLGHTSKGKPRTMFRPYRHMNATGIREVKRWADSPRGKFKAQPFVILGNGVGCDSGMCGEG